MYIDHCTKKVSGSTGTLTCTPVPAHRLVNVRVEVRCYNRFDKTYYWAYSPWRATDGTKQMVHTGYCGSDGNATSVNAQHKPA